ncbi:MAG: hypothetical protein JSV74_01985 [Dehalococcoidia bacterium]|nr:MAG: hypothetical protein JSV74_01985 [Dehalococcoidia bacterium]
MKNNRFFRILVTNIALVTITLSMSIVPVSAIVSVNVNPIEGEIGDNITLSGFGTLNWEYYLFFSSQNADLADEIDDEVTTYDFLVSVTANGPAGSWSAPNLSVPSMLNDGAFDEIVHGGIYYIYMTTSISKTIEAKTTFNVISLASVTGFTPNEGTVGTEVEISGTGFAQNENIVVEYDGEQIDIESGDEQTDNDGDFILYLIIPESQFGEHMITVIGEDSSAELAVVFTVKPVIYIIPTSGEAGSVITVTGNGFEKYHGVNFSFGGTAFASVSWLVESIGRTNGNGSFAVNLTIPYVAAGSYVILAEDEEDNNIFAEKFFTIRSTITPSITITTTATQTTVVTIPGVSTTVTRTVTTEPTTRTISQTETKTVTAEPTTATIQVTKTVTTGPTTTPIDEDSDFNAWIPVTLTLVVIIVLLVLFILYVIRSKEL